MDTLLVETLLVDTLLVETLLVDTLLLRTTDSFRDPNSMQTILNNPDLADTHRPFQQDCPPLLV